MPVAERFWAKVAKSTDDACWPWLGYRKPSGHGLTTYQCFSVHASRKAWILTHGPIRGDWCVLHRCDNAACCNPAHLYLGTRIDNQIDRWENIPASERGHRNRPTLLTDEQLKLYWRLRKQGQSVRQAASELGVHHWTVYRALKARIQQRRKVGFVRAQAI